MEYIFYSSDLTISLGAGAFPLVVTNATNSTLVSGIPSTDTILRAAIRQSPSISSSTCTNYSGDSWIGDDYYAQAFVQYGFALNSWIGDLLPQSVASSKYFAFSMIDHFTASLDDSDVLPNWTLAQTANIFLHGMPILDFACPYVDVSDTYHALNNSSDPIQMLTGMQRALSEELNWTGIAASEIKVEFSAFQLSPQVQYDAVTFELPVDPDTRHLHFATKTRAFSTPDVGEFFQDQVRIMCLCKTEDDKEYAVWYKPENCTFVTSSMLIYSIAHHIASDEVDISENGGKSKHVSLKNVQMKYSVTVGRLS